MKFVKMMVVAMAIVLLAGYAKADPVVKILPEGSITANPGDELSFSVHLFADPNENLRMGLYAFSLWLDPEELQFKDWTYGPEPDDPPFTEHVYTSWEKPRVDEKTNFEPWWGSFDANNPVFKVAELNAGDDWELGTVTVTVLNPVQDGDWDIKLKYYEPMGENFFTNDWDPHQYEQVEGPDVAPVVPIPGALWLLGSGLIGLVAIRRKR